MERQAGPVHDEINLLRLLRRLEKSVEEPSDWETSPTQSSLDVWTKSLTGIQRVKYAKQLVKTIEVEEDDVSPRRIAELNDRRAKLDQIESFLLDVSKTYKPKPTKLPSLLSTLPIPHIESQRPPISANSRETVLVSGDSLSPTPSYSDELIAPGLPGLSTKGLNIEPPSHDAEMSPTLITSLLPSHLPEDDATTTSFTRARQSTNTIPTMRHGTTALHEELASQLEAMAAQLKRNAIYTSTSLANDRAVVEALGDKLEVNHDVMTKERTRLRDHSSKSGGTTWLSVGIILLVILLFVVMVGVIRFSRI